MKNILKYLHLFEGYIQNTEEMQKKIVDIIKNFEKHKDKITIYTFAEKLDVVAYLNSLNINNSAVEEIPMSLEDAFIGITGKY